MPKFNVAVQVVDLIDAPTEAEAVAALTKRVTEAGLDVLETSGNAFESEDSEYPTSTCGCGHDITYYGEDEGWQHNAAPFVWGDDHDAHPEEEGKRAAEAYDREHSTYKIKRFYQGGYETEVIETGLSYQDAKDHCDDPETSSKTATNAAGVALTRERGGWFDGFEAE